MSVKTRDLGMTPLDDLFSTDESRAESQFEKVVTLNPAEDKLCLPVFPYILIHFRLYVQVPHAAVRLCDNYRVLIKKYRLNLPCSNQNVFPSG